MNRFVLIALTAAACSPPPVPGSAECPNDLASSCPSPQLSYRVHVEPLVRSKCLACHVAGGQASSQPLDSYAAVFERRTHVLAHVYGCEMPPVGAPALTLSERAVLLGWLVCDAPEE